ncbi:MAG: DUF488 domain-containing protein [Chitinophagaceae bacterium]|jgi:uncharacterized protein (DUF488 family)|nr:DUF488 domain-containing protein [Chitinophagaceae bacterium]OQY94372.1 MAG: Fe-S cluster assembly protein HesB [Sphingobacteriales bacterium UTBCD1]
MSSPERHTVYTIGHSTHSIEEFINMLHSFSIEHLVDIRSFPGSRKFPQFNKENLEASLKENGIEYTHIKELGGRRKVKKDSKNTRWRKDSFRGYADYMETENFAKGIERLQEIAKQQNTAYMCSEAVWWRCHRSMVSDYLKAKGWKVLHIMNANKADEHPYTSPARVAGDHVFYSDEDLFTENTDHENKI